MDGPPEQHSQARLEVDRDRVVRAATPAAIALAGRNLTGLPLTLFLDQDGDGAWRSQATRGDEVPIVVDVVATDLGGGRRALDLAEVDGATDAHGRQRLLDAAFEIAPIAMAFFDTYGRYVRVNPALCALLGREPADLLGRRDQELTHPDDRAADVAAAWRILRGEIDRWQTEKRFVHSDGSIVWVIANLAFVRDEEGRALAWVGQFQDITARKQLEADLRDQADRDPLTGLPNRRRFSEELGALLAHGRRTHAGTSALLVIDLDEFKAINDTHGHAAGDAVLIAIARRLHDRVRAEDLVARIGGDEFAVLLRGAGAEAAAAVARQLHDAVASLRDDLGVPAVPRMSIGIELIEASQAHTVESLMDAADRAMYRAKR